MNKYLIIISICFAMVLLACSGTIPKGIHVDKPSDIIDVLIEKYKNGDKYDDLASISKGKLQQNIDIIAKKHYKYIITTNPQKIYTEINDKEPILADNQKMYGIMSSFAKAGSSQLKLGEYFKGYVIINHNKDTDTYYISEFAIHDEKK